MALEVQSHATSGAATHLDSVQQAIESLKTTGFHTEINQDRSLPSNTNTAARSDTAPSVGGASTAKIASDGSIDFHPSPTPAATPPESSGWLASAGHDAALFGEGLVSGAVLNPINALGQLSNHALGTDFGSVKFSNQDEVDNSMSGKIGEFLGTTADFIGLTVATGGLGDAVGLAGAGGLALSAGTAGVIEGGLLTPTSDTGFIAGRLENAAIMGAAGAAGVAGGAAVGALADGVSNSAARIAVKAVGGTLTGAAAGAGTAEAGSLAATGQLASSDQLAMAAAAGAVGGAIGGLADVIRGSSSDSTVTKSNETESTVGGDPTKLAAQGITNEGTLRSSIAQTLQQAHEKDVSISVDATKPMTDAAGNPIKATQADILYDELAKAYPDQSYTFSKPELNPGDPGYTEFPAPRVTQDGLQISTKENPMTVGNGFTLADGTEVPAGSQFAVGTTYDGAAVKSADPTGKVWATTPDGSFVQVANAGDSAAIPNGAISTETGKTGQVVNAKTPDGADNHIIVRTAKATDPDGKPLLDAYPSGGKGFNEAYKDGSQPGYYAPKAKSADHFMLPDSITVEAETAYGHSTASGIKGDFYMRSGFADAADATAKNYTGRTDPRSAAALLRLRGAQGITGPTQAEAGLLDAGLASK